MNRVRIRILEDSKYAIRTLYRHNINIYNISGNIYTVDESALDSLNENYYEIVSYKGIKSLIYKIRRHRHFIGGLIISILMMFVMSNIIVDVDVIHSNKDIRVLIEDELYDLGIRPLIFKKSFAEIQKIKERIKETYPDDIDWLEIIDEGMRYTVRVEERIITEIEEEPRYCNVISTKDGVVLNIVSSKGQTIVDANDYVRKGDVLISGEVKFNEEVKSHTCAEGVVYGNTWYRVAVSVPLEHSEKVYTGSEMSNLGLEFGSKYARVFKVHMGEYDVEKRKLFSIGKFAIYRENIREYTSKKETYSEEEALKKALEEGRKKLAVKLLDDASILSEKVLQSNSYNSIISVEIFYSVKEVISERVESEYVEENEAKEDEELE